MQRLLRFNRFKFLGGIISGLIFALLAVYSFLDISEGISVTSVNGINAIYIKNLLFFENSFWRYSFIRYALLALIFFWKNYEENARVCEFLDTMPVKNGARDFIDYVMMSVIVFISGMASMLQMLILQNGKNKALIGENSVTKEFVKEENINLIKTYIIYILLWLIIFSAMYIITILTKNRILSLFINLFMIYRHIFDIFMNTHEIGKELNKCLEDEKSLLIESLWLILTLIVMVYAVYFIARAKENTKGKIFYSVFLRKKSQDGLEV